MHACSLPGHRVSLECGQQAPPVGGEVLPASFSVGRRWRWAAKRVWPARNPRLCTGRTHVQKPSIHIHYSRPAIYQLLPPLPLLTLPPQINSSNPAPHALSTPATTSSTLRYLNALAILAVRLLHLRRPYVATRPNLTARATVPALTSTPASRRRAARRTPQVGSAEHGENSL